MCGIVCYYNNHQTKLFDNKKLSAFENSINILNHRGPDANGRYIDENYEVFLGHVRLSIIDTSEAANQPFILNERFVIVFNGELYNYKELSLQFDCLKTSSDTEIIVRCFEKDGINCFKYFRGMFALCIWDLKNRELIVARDHLGIKPLFFYETIDGGIVFSSEIKAIKPWVHNFSFKESIVFDYLYNANYDHPKKTFYENIFRLEAGSYMRIKNGSSSIKKWFDIKYNLNLINSQSLEFDQAYLKYEKLLQETLDIAFRADVEVGICLSGGIDSAVMATFASKKVNNLPAYFCSFENYSDDEYKRAYDLASKNSIELKTCFFRSSEFNDYLTELLFSQMEPIGGLQTLAYAKMFKDANKDGIKVLLEAQGIDEILAGYPYYNLSLPKNANVHIDGTEIIVRKFLNKDYKNHFKSLKPNFKENKENKLLEKQIHDISLRKIPRVLRMNDLISMSSSIELREPFLDPILLLNCLSFNDDIKIKSNIGKYIHRVLANNLNISKINSNKNTVVTPQSKWLFNECYDDVFDILELARNDHKYDLKSIKSFLINSHKSVPKNSFGIWQILNTILLEHLILKNEN